MLTKFSYDIICNLRFLISSYIREKSFWLSFSWKKCFLVVSFMNV